MQAAGGRTVAGYRRYLLAQQRDKAAAQSRLDAAARIKRTVLGRVRVCALQSGLEAGGGAGAGPLPGHRPQSGMVLEQMTPEQFAGNIPVKSYAELVAMTQDTCFDSLRCCLLGGITPKTMALP